MLDTSDGHYWVVALLLRIRDFYSFCLSILSTSSITRMYYLHHENAVYKSKYRFQVSQYMWKRTQIFSVTKHIILWVTSFKMENGLLDLQ